MSDLEIDASLLEGIEIDPSLLEDNPFPKPQPGETAKSKALRQLGEIEPGPFIDPQSSTSDALSLGAASGTTVGQPEQLGNPFFADTRPFVRVNALPTG